MDVSKSRPGDRDHLGRRVEFHGARTERNHAAVQRQVPVGKSSHIAKHLMLRLVKAEYGMSHESGLSRHFNRNTIQTRRERPLRPKCPQDSKNDLLGGLLIE